MSANAQTMRGIIVGELVLAAILVPLAYVSPELAADQIAMVTAVAMLPGLFIWRRLERRRVLMWIAWTAAMPALGLLTGALHFELWDSCAHCVPKASAAGPMVLILLWMAVGFAWLSQLSRHYERERSLVATLAPAFGRSHQQDPNR